VGFTDAPDGGDFALARYNADGSLDTTFGTGGKVTTGFGAFSIDVAFGVALQPNGKIVVAGYTAASDVVADFAVARYNADGSLDTSFGTGGKVTTDFGGFDLAPAVALQPDGKIVVAGWTEDIFFAGADFAVARYNPDGRLDAGFGTGGKVTTSFGAFGCATGVALQPNGKIVVAGNTTDAVGGEDFALARYNANGGLDAGFGTGGKVTTDFGGDDFANGVALQPDGKIVVAGATFLTTDYDFAVARYQGDAGGPSGPEEGGAGRSEELVDVNGTATNRLSDRGNAEDRQTTDASRAVLRVLLIGETVRQDDRTDETAFPGELREWLNHYVPADRASLAISAPWDLDDAFASELL
jgi:uncharacterized delta-60 repeat protein